MPIFNMSPDFLMPRAEKVMFGGEQAVGAPLESLSEAKKLKEKGIPAEEIYARTKTPDTTGWFQGAEGNWRFEFNDKDAQLDPNVLSQLYSGRPIQLENLLKHPQLYQYYPHLKEVQISTITPENEAQGISGLYDPKKNVLQLAKDPQTARTTLLHELQHMIQSKENWAKGGNAASPASFAAINLIQQKMALSNKMYDEINLERKKINDQFTDRFRNIANIEGTEKEQALEKLKAEFTQALNASSQSIENKYKKAIDDIESTIQKAIGMKQSLNPFDIYQRLSGETEARNVETRELMDLLQRQRSFPPTTQDYPYEEQLTVKSAP